MNSPSSPPLVWHLELLGGLSARRVDLPQAPRLEKFPTQKVASLLAYLALYRKVHSREDLYEIFWPNKDLEKAQNSLRVALSQLRKLLEPAGVEYGSVLDTSRGVALTSAVECDAELFQATWTAAQSATTVAQRQEALNHALSLYKGLLLLGLAPEWLMGEDVDLENIYLQAVQTLTALLEAKEQTPQALEMARAAMKAAPQREELLQETLLLGLKTDQFDQVYRDYEIWSKRAEQRHSALSTETKELAERVKNSQSRAGSPRINKPTPLPEIRDVAPPAFLKPRGRSLPGQWTKFFGRETELATLRDWLEDDSTRLVTVTGPGGSGKTRLAQEFGRRVKVAPEISTDGYTHFSLVEWVPLADLRDTKHIPGVILNAIGEPRSDESFEMVVDVLRQSIIDNPQSRLLLIFDNFEHLREAGSPLVYSLLEEVPELVCLITSRQRLGFVGEREWPLQPLETPALGNIVEGQEFSASVQLFLNRAKLARQDFAITTENRDDVMQLCAKLDGLPLALELAAARVTLFSPAQILAELDRQLYWKNEDRTAPERHGSLHAAIAWSQRQLPPPVARFWAGLSIFRGGWTLDAAVAVCDEPEGPPLMLALRDVSLISLDRRGDTPRGSQLEVLREYAAEALTEKEREALAARHARYFLNWAERIVPQLTGPRAPRLLPQFEAELDNLRGGLEWYLQHDVEGALRFTSALWWGWELRGHLTEGLLALAKTLEAADRAFPKAQEEAGQDLPGARQRLNLWARTLNGAGKLATNASDLSKAQTYLEKSLQYFRLLDDQGGIADCLYSLGYMHLKDGDRDTARTMCDESVSIFRTLGEPLPLCDALYNRAVVAIHEGEFKMVRRLNDERLEILREAGELRGVAISLETLGIATLFEENIGAAHAYFSESLAIFESIDETRGVLRVLWALGHVARFAQQSQLAIDNFTKALHLARVTQSLWTLPYILEAFAYMALEEEDMPRATRLVSGAAFMRETYNEPLPGSMFQEEFDRVVKQLRRSMTQSHFESEWLLGRTLSRDALLEFALNGTQRDSSGQNS